MLIEPLPLFDCMYCVKDYQLVFTKMSEKYLSKKYSCTDPGNLLDDFSDIDNNHVSKLLQREERVNKKISFVDEDKPFNYLHSELQLQIMILNDPLLILDDRP